MSSQYIDLPAPGSASWKAPVATSGDLPSSGNSAGDARAAEDTGIVYVWDGSSWIAQGGGSSTSPSAPDGSIQYNNSGAFGGFGSWSGTTMSVPGAVVISDTSANPIQAVTSYSGGDVSMLVQGSPPGGSGVFAQMYDATSLTNLFFGNRGGNGEFQCSGNLFNFVAVGLSFNVLKVHPDTGAISDTSDTTAIDIFSRIAKASDGTTTNIDWHLPGRVLVTGATDDGSTQLQVNGLQQLPITADVTVPNVTSFLVTETPGGQWNGQSVDYFIFAVNNSNPIASTDVYSAAPATYSITYDNDQFYDGSITWDDMSENFYIVLYNNGGTTWAWISAAGTSALDNGSWTNTDTGSSDPTVSMQFLMDNGAGNTTNLPSPQSYITSYTYGKIASFTNANGANSYFDGNGGLSVGSAVSMPSFTWNAAGWENTTVVAPIPPTGGGGINISATAASPASVYMSLTAQTGTPDQNVWAFYVNGATGDFNFQPINDAWSSGSDIMRLTRAGNMSLSGVVTDGTLAAASFNSRYLYYTDGTTISFDWAASEGKDTSGNPAFVWSNPAGVQFNVGIADWSGAIPVINTNARTLIGSGGATVVMNWTNALRVNIGGGTLVGGDHSIGIGDGSLVDVGFTNCTIVGANSNGTASSGGTGTNYTFFGYGNSSGEGNDRATALGTGNVIGFPDSMVLGHGLTITASNQVIIGDASGAYNDFVLGTNPSSSTAGAVTLRVSALSGSNQTGGALTIRPGNGTGTGGSGSFIVQTAPVAASSSTANTMANALEITNAKALKAGGKFTQYNGITTVTNGVPSLLGTSDLTAQSAAKTATTLYAVPSAGVGLYRVNFVASVTTAGSTSSILGGTNGFQIIYTDADDSVVKTSTAGLTEFISNANTTGTTVSGSLIANCKASTNLQFKFDYTSVGITAMQYNLHIRAEAL